MYICKDSNTTSWDSNPVPTTIEQLKSTPTDQSFSVSEERLLKCLLDHCILIGYETLTHHLGIHFNCRSSETESDWSVTPLKYLAKNFDNFLLEHVWTSQRVAWFFIKRGQVTEACPESNIYDSFFIKWFTK